MSEENEKYQQYEKLLFERDKYKKQAGEYLRDYIREFGELLTEVFRKKISCIEKKKMISYCQIRLNRGEMIDAQAMSEYIRREMDEYNERLADMMHNNELCRKDVAISNSDVMQIKRIYRRIAKKIHPDINPAVSESHTLMDLWNRVVISYDCNDLILTVRDEQAFAITKAFPEIKDKVFSLSTFAAANGLVMKDSSGRVMSISVPDPSGENYETYLHTAKALNAWLEILFPYILKDLGASRV